MSLLTCPKCDTPCQKGGYKTWQIIVAICFFPIGLIALLLDKEPTQCHKCSHMWQA